MKYCTTCERVYSIHLQHGEYIKGKVDYHSGIPTYGKKREECIHCSQKELKQYLEKKYGEKK